MEIASALKFGISLSTFGYVGDPVINAKLIGYWTTISLQFFCAITHGSWAVAQYKMQIPLLLI
jgi:hypothetical protein